VTRRVLTRPIRAPGVVQADEHRQSLVRLRFYAFIERLEHVTTGDQVHQGEPLMRLYSSALSSAAAEYLTDLAARDSTVLPSDKGARRRLENLGIPEQSKTSSAPKKLGSPRLAPASSPSIMSSKVCAASFLRVDSRPRSYREMLLLQKERGACARRSDGVGSAVQTRRAPS
jgi:hypothetical protein